MLYGIVLGDIYTSMNLFLGKLGFTPLWFDLFTINCCIPRISCPNFSRNARVARVAVSCQCQCFIDSNRVAIHRYM